MSIAQLEAYLTEHIEGFFNKRLTGEIELSELKRLLAREVGRKKETRDGQTFAPEEYAIFLPADDYGRFCSERINALLANTVRGQIIKEDAFLAGKLIIAVKKAAPEQGFALAASFVELDAAKEAMPTEEQHTIVLTRQKFKTPLALPVEQKFAALSVVAGCDEGAYAEFGAKTVFIGRQDRSDFILTDDTVSRIHASIEYKSGRHFLRDEKSANGTRVNGEKIAAPCVLRHGDEIETGDTVIRYEVV